MTSDMLDLSKNTESIDTVPESCTNMPKGHGFIVKTTTAEDGTSTSDCSYSFSKKVDFLATPEDASDPNTDYSGYTLTFTSDQACGDSFFKVSVEATCGTDGAETWSSGAEDDCSAILKYTGAQGCKEYSFKYMRYAEVLKPYIGALMIIGGLFLVFVGSKLVVQIFSIAIFFTVLLASFVTFYNVILPKSTPGYAYLIILILCGVAGGFAAYYTKKLAETYAVALVAGWGGVILALVIAEIVGITNATATVAMAAVLGVLGFIAGKEMNRLVKCSVTAFIGAGFVMKGVSFYLTDLNAYNADNVNVDSV